MKPDAVQKSAGHDRNPVYPNPCPASKSLAWGLLKQNTMETNRAAKKWENLAKYFYDLSKVTITLAVVAPIATHGLFNLKLVALSAVVSISLAWFGWRCDKKGASL